MRALNLLLTAMILVMWPFLWVWCRLEAKRCPNCASKWRTELVGEWSGEDWYCHRCGQFWVVR